MSAKTKRVGVGWKKTDANGREFHSIIITNPVGKDFNYALWPAEGEKRTEFSPDWIVTAQADNAPAPAAKPKPAAADEFPDDDKPPF